MRNLTCLFALVISISGCSKNDAAINPAPDTMYFPATTNNEWETTSISSLGWNTDSIQALKNYLVQKNTKSFMILVNGRIVLEEYFNGHNATASWEWNSAGKTLVAATVGIAQQESLLNINNRVSQYLGTGWTSEPLAKENLITSRHLLTMTSGTSDSSNLVTTANLTYMADAGTRWSYANIFQKLMDVVGQAANSNFETYFNNRLKLKIGMDGFWNNGFIFKIYHSNTRSMARFGLLALNKGRWNNEQVVNQAYFNEMVTSSQNINPSYGYLCWLNGKTSHMIPGGQAVYQGSLVPNAPADMFAAMGASDQRIYVVPSKKMVVIRMGEASDPSNPSFAVSGFDNILWGKINAAIN